LSDHAKGLLLTTLAILIITPDALLIRLVSMDAWTLTFWRGLLSAIGLAIGLLAIHRGRFISVLLAVGGWGLVIGTLFGITTVTFVTAITTTTAANTLLIIATGSMFGALFSWLLLREPVLPRTWFAMAGTGIGVLVLVAADLGAGRLFGDLMALATAALAGLTFTLIRKHALVDMVPTVIFGGIVTAVIALPFSAPDEIAIEDTSILLVMGLLMLPLSFALQFIGPRYIPAPEVSLLVLLEAVLGPLLVWYWLGEHPGEWAFVGGAIVIATLALHAAWGLHQERKRAQVTNDRCA